MVNAACRQRSYAQPQIKLTGHPHRKIAQKLDVIGAKHPSPNPSPLLSSNRTLTTRHPGESRHPESLLPSLEAGQQLTSVKRAAGYLSDKLQSHPKSTKLSLGSLSWLYPPTLALRNLPPRPSLPRRRPLTPAVKSKIPRILPLRSPPSGCPRPVGPRPPQWAARVPLPALLPGW